MRTGTLSNSPVLPPIRHSLYMVCLFQTMCMAETGSKLAYGGREGKGDTLALCQKAPAAWRCKTGMNPNLGSSREGGGGQTQEEGTEMLWVLHRGFPVGILPSFSTPKRISGSQPQAAAPSHLGTQRSLLYLRLPPFSVLGRRVGCFWETPAETALCMVS